MVNIADIMPTNIELSAEIESNLRQYTRTLMKEAVYVASLDNRKEITRRDVLIARRMIKGCHRL